MDAVVDGEPVTQRPGLPVEVNALWYNAVCSALAFAGGRDKKFVASWKELPDLIRNSFIEQFWVEEKDTWLIT